MSGHLMSAEENFNEILQRYEQYVSGSNTGYFDVEELELIVDYYLQKGRTKDSSKVVELGLKLHPASTSLQNKRAKIYLAMGEKEKALKIVESNSDARDFENELLRGEILVKLHRFLEADAIFEQLLPQEDADEKENLCLDIAYFYLSVQAYDKSLSYLQLGLKENPDNIDLLFELAFSFEQMGKTEECIQAYNRIIDLDAYSGEAWFNLGQVHFAQENYAKAIEAYEFATIINDSDSAAWLQKAHALFQVEKYELAIESYLSYSHLTVHKSMAMVFIGECYEKLEEFDNAIAYYKLAIEDSEENIDAWTGLTICYLEKEDYEKSVEAAQKGLSLDTEIGELWVYLAEAYVNLNQLQEAVESYLRSLEIQPFQPDTLASLGSLLLDLGNFQGARDAYLKAYEQSKETENISLFLAIAYFKTEEYQSALYFLEEAMRKNDNAFSAFIEICPEAANIIEDYLNRDRS